MSKAGTVLHTLLPGVQVSYTWCQIKCLQDALALLLIRPDSLALVLKCLWSKLSWVQSVLHITVFLSC